MFVNRWLILGIVSTALILIMVDMTVLYTALPALSQSLAATASEKLWIVNIYALVVAGLLPATGALSDRYGPKPIFIIGLVIFGLASGCAAFAPSSDFLVGARVALAAGAALMMPPTLAIIRHVFEDPSELSFAIGVWAAVAAGGAAFGPVVGGVLLEFFWWGSVFLINIPIVIFALALSILLIPHTGGSRDRRVDMVGVIQVMIGLVSLIVLIKELSKGSISIQAVVPTALMAFIFLWLFTRRQMRSQNPMIDFTLFRNRDFSIGVLAAIFFCAALIGVEFSVSQRFQLVLGLTPLQAGLAILPIAGAAFIAGPLAGLILPKLGTTRMIWLSLLAGGLGTAAAGLLAELGLIAQILSLSVVGAAAGSGMTAASSAIMLSAPPERAGAAASIEEVSYELGGAIGIAILGGMLSGIYSSAFVTPAGLADPEVARDSYDGALQQAAEAGPDVATQILSAAETAFDTAFLSVMLTASGLLIVAAICIVISIKRNRLRRDDAAP